MKDLVQQITTNGRYKEQEATWWRGGNGQIVTYLGLYVRKIASKGYFMRHFVSLSKQLNCQIGQGDVEDSFLSFLI